MARITAGIVSTAWAETGDKVSFEDIGDPGSRLRTEGFDSTYSQPGGKKPERELVNNELNIANNFILDVQLHGVLEWDIAVTYNTPSLVFGTDGELYKAKRNSGPTPLSPHNPVTDSAETYWEPFYKSLPALTLAQIPDLPASKTTSGVFDEDRIPDLSASKINSGTLSINRIPNIPASQTMSGIFDVDRIPGLDAGKIVSGIFNINRIPMIPADHITGFVTPSVLGAENIPITITTAQVSGTANAIILSPAPAWSSYTIGQRFLFRPNLDSTGNVTINVSNLGARQVWWWGKRLAADGFIRTRTYECVIYSSTRIHIVGVLFGDSVLYNAGSGAGNLPILESNTQLHVDRIPDLPANKITSGVFSIDRIPNLNANKITTGVLDEDRIPDLDATKITTGLLGIARIPDLSGLYASEVLLASNQALVENTNKTINLTQSAANFTRYRILYSEDSGVASSVGALRRKIDAAGTLTVQALAGGTFYLLTEAGNWYSMTNAGVLTWIRYIGRRPGGHDVELLQHAGINYVIVYRRSGNDNQIYLHTITDAGVFTEDTTPHIVGTVSTYDFGLMKVVSYNNAIYIFLVNKFVTGSTFRLYIDIYRINTNQISGTAFTSLGRLQSASFPSVEETALLLPFVYRERLYVALWHSIATTGFKGVFLVDDTGTTITSVLIRTSSFLPTSNIPTLDSVAVTQKDGKVVFLVRNDSDHSTMYDILEEDLAQVNGTTRASFISDVSGYLSSEGDTLDFEEGLMVSGALPVTTQEPNYTSGAGIQITRDGANLIMRSARPVTIDAIYGILN